jgi:hypothetical protein
MIRGKIENIMRTALVKFSNEEKESVNDIKIVIHTKHEEYIPEYFYLVKGVPKKDENGKTKAITFNQILDKKFDLLNKEMIAAQYLKNWFKNVGKDVEASPKELYVMIGADDEEAKKLYFALFKNGEPLKELKLDEIFGED